MGRPVKKSTTSRISRALMTALTVLLIFLMFDIMSIVADIQGTARVVNYAGLVRGTTQRIVKLEDAHIPQDKLIENVDSFIDGLRYGSDDLNLVSLPDEAFQAKMAELDGSFDVLRSEIGRVREVGYENTSIIEMSESFFGICDEATKLAEKYSQEKATALRSLENVAIADIVALVAVFGIEFARALRTAAQNRALRKKVYLDEATGLPNKNKCEELLDDPNPIAPDAPVAVFVFDMNNLRAINNNLGHEKGDEYIKSFADQLAKIASDRVFVGRDGGDEFIAIARNATHDNAAALLDDLRAHAAEYSADHPAMPISYAAGYALSTDFDGPDMRALFREADKNMYVDKNRAKMAEAAARTRENQQVLARLEHDGFHFADYLYCDASLDQYRALRTSSNAFLAEDGNYTGAIEQIVAALADANDRAKLRLKLQPESLRAVLKAEGDTTSILYQKEGHRGRITAVCLDCDDAGLHHFALGFVPFHETSANEKLQVSRYYDQMRNSFLENADYVGALLDSAQAAYSVDFTHDLLERIFSQDLGKRHPLNIDPPCSYDGYCAERSQYVSGDTLENYRLVDTSAKLLARFASGSRQVTTEYREIGSDGEPIWLQKIVLMSHDVSICPETGADEAVVRGIILFRDSSAFHKQERDENRALEEQLATATAESKTKTEFMNRMSHDFRTPINGIMGMLEIARMNGDDPARVSDCMDKIQLSANHLLDLVNDVLDMSKLQSGKAVIEREPFDIEELMDEVRDVMEGQIEEMGLTHRSHRGNIEHLQLVGSPLRLRQIMLNLFSNAVKYNKPGGAIDTYASELSCDGNVAALEFRISDTGIGMSPDFVQNELFSPFTQEHGSARTHYRGTGLGMSIVKSLVDAMNGTIEARSVQGEGTTFTFTLPFEIDHRAEENAAADEAHDGRNGAEIADLHGMRVLLVEDNALNMEIGQLYLESAGAEVVQAWNGKEAVDTFASSSPNSISLVLMDIMMPMMDGYQAARAIRATVRPDAATVPIIAMTANAFDEDRKRTRASGMNAHFTKPLDMKSLVAEIAKYR